MSLNSFNPGDMAAMQDAFESRESVESNEAERTSPEQDRNIQRDRIAFELRRIANELNNGQGITSLRDTDQLVRFTDSVNLCLVNRIAPIFDDRIVSQSEIDSLVAGRTQNMLVNTLQELRVIGNQLQLSQEAELRDLEVLNQAEGILDETQFRNIDNRFSFMDNAVLDMQQSLDDLNAISNAQAERYFSINGVDQFVRDQETLNDSERQFYEANEIVISTYNNSIIRSYNDVADSLAEYNSIIDRLSLVGSRHVIRRLEEYRESLLERRTVAANHINRLNNHTLLQTTDSLRSSIVEARTKVSDILSEGINARIDESTELAQREQEDANSHGQQLINLTEERNNEIRERLRQERDLLEARQQEIEDTKQRIDDESGDASSLLEIARNEIELSERNLIDRISHFCRINSIGVNQFNEFLNSQPTLLNSLTPTQRQNLLIAIARVVPNPNAQGSITTSRNQGLTGSLERSLQNTQSNRRTRDLMTLLNTFSQINSQKENPILNFDFNTLKDNLDHESEDIRNRISNIDLTFESLDNSLENVRNSVSEHLHAVESQIRVLSLTMQEGMQKLYEVQGNNDLAKEGFVSNAISITESRNLALSENHNLGNQIDQLRIPEVPSVFTRSFRMVTLPIAAAGDIIDRGIGTTLHFSRGTYTALIHGAAVLSGQATLSWSEAMQDYSLDNFFNYRASEFMLESGQQLTDFRLELLRNGTIPGHLAQFPLAFVANLANATGAIIETLKRLDYITSAIGTIASSENPGQNLIDIGGTIFHIDDLVERGDVIGWAGNMSSEVVIVIATFGTGSLVRATATALTKQAVVMSPTLTRASTAVRSINISSNTFKKLSNIIEISRRITSVSTSPARTVTGRTMRAAGTEVAEISAHMDILENFTRRNNFMLSAIRPFYLDSERVNTVMYEFENENINTNGLEREIETVIELENYFNRFNESGLALYFSPDMSTTRTSIET